MLEDTLKSLVEFGVSKEEIAKRAGVNRKTIYNIMNGFTPTPAVEKVVRLAIQEIKEGIANA